MTVTESAPRTESIQAWETRRQSKTRRSPVWRQIALARAGRIVQQRDTLIHDYPQLAHDRFLRHQVTQRLDNAVKLACDPTRPSDWWTGAQVEACWRELRLAEEAIVHVCDKPRLDALAQDALNHARAYLPAGDKRVERLHQVLQTQASEEPALRSSIAPVLAAGHEASDKAHQDMRSYQNLLRTITLVLAFLAAASSVVAVVVVGTERLLPGPIWLSQGWTVVVTFAAGAMGALFSAIPSLAQIPENGAPFNPIREQAGLKVVVGAWSGVIGMLAVTAGLQAADIKNLAGLLMVAALFGANQEALTRFADHKADKLRGASAP